MVGFCSDYVGVLDCKVNYFFDFGWLIMSRMKSGFIRAEEFFWFASQYRVVNVRGRYGSGKTLLCVALAYEFWKRRTIEKIYSNFPMAGRSEEYKEKDTNFLMILDEGHIVLDARSFSKSASQSWLRDLRKRKAILVLPAVLSVDNRFRSLLVQRIIQFGDLLWLYRYQIDDGAGQVSGTFGLYQPGQYFGSYDTNYSPSDEDFDKLLRVMSGSGKYKLQGSDNENNQAVVYDASYPVEENPTLAKPVHEPSFREIFRPSK